MKAYLLFISLWLGGVLMAHSQILFTESFNVILDTANKVQGSIIPDFKFQTQQEDLLEFENQADISMRMKNNALTVANKIELAQFGNTVFLSGGYLYAEYRRIIQKRFAPELFGQIQWAEARGLEWKYATGIYARARIVARPKIGYFMGIGPFYEFERWNFDGVPPTAQLGENLDPVEQKGVKLGSYASVKWMPHDKFSFDMSIYHQSRFDQLFNGPRLASSLALTYQFTRHLGLVFMHQFIYDFKPVVPIRQDFHRVVVSVSISF